MVVASPEDLMPILLLRAPAHACAHSLVHHTQMFLRVFFCAVGVEAAWMLSLSGSTRFFFILRMAVCTDRGHTSVSPQPHYFPSLLTQVHRMIAEFKLIPGLNNLFDKLIWRKHSASALVLHGHNQNCDCSPVSRRPGSSRMFTRS